MKMPTKKPSPNPMPPKSVNFSMRLSESDAKRVEAIASAHDWPLAKTLQKLVIAALDAKMLK